MKRYQLSLAAAAIVGSLSAVSHAQTLTWGIQPTAPLPIGQNYTNDEDGSNPPVTIDNVADIGDWFGTGNWQSSSSPLAASPASALTNFTIEGKPNITGLVVNTINGGLSDDEVTANAAVRGRSIVIGNFNGRSANVIFNAGFRQVGTDSDTMRLGGTASKLIHNGGNSSSAADNGLILSSRANNLLVQVNGGVLDVRRIAFDDFDSSVNKSATFQVTGGSFRVGGAGLNDSIGGNGWIGQGEGNRTLNLIVSGGAFRANRIVNSAPLATLNVDLSSSSVRFGGGNSTVDYGSFGGAGFRLTSTAAFGLTVSPTMTPILTDETTNLSNVAPVLTAATLSGWTVGHSYTLLSVFDNGFGNGLENAFTGTGVLGGLFNYTLLTQRVSGATAYGGGWRDNYLLRIDSVVPEPTTLAAVAGVAVLMLRRRLIDRTPPKLPPQRRDTLTGVLPLSDMADNHPTQLLPAAARHEPGSQRLTLQRLHAFESLGYGLFLHFGMSTFVGHEAPDGTHPSSRYNPTALDVDQWIRVARDAGMTYAILTAKHHSGHCLWPSEFTQYHVGTSSNPTDVVAAFVRACDRHGLKAGLYYASWDNHHVLGSALPSAVGFGNAWCSAAYIDFQLRQVEELCRRYAPLNEFWIDIPGFLGPAGRKLQYDQLASLLPDAYISFNQGFENGDRINTSYAWPTDLCTMERRLPSNPFRHGYYDPWFDLDIPGRGKGSYYIPGEVCDSIGRNWFWVEGDSPRPRAELLAMRLMCHARRVNFLLNVPPDITGRIRQTDIQALTHLRRDFETVVSQS